MEDRLLPHDFDSEQGLLASAFCPRAMNKIEDMVSSDDFYSSSAKLIFQKMEEFHKSGREFTISLVDQSLESHPQYPNARRALDVLVPITAEVAPHFARIVRELSDRRRAIKASYSVFEDLFDVSNPVDQVRGFLRVQVPGLLTEVSQ